MWGLLNRFAPRAVSEEERAERDARPRLPKVDGGRRRGMVFYMAFLYTPMGTQIFTGDLESITKNASKLPTCHGWLVPYRGKQQIGKGSPWLFGKHTHTFESNKYPRLYLMHKSPRCHDDVKHRCYQLVLYTQRDSMRVLATIRRLPKQYLHALKEFDKTPS
jgi:hypothetical protein